MRPRIRTSLKPVDTVEKSMHLRWHPPIITLQRVVLICVAPAAVLFVWFKDMNAADAVFWPLCIAIFGITLFTMTKAFRRRVVLGELEKRSSRSRMLWLSREPYFVCSEEILATLVQVSVTGMKPVQIQFEPQQDNQKACYRNFSEEIISRTSDFELGDLLTAHSKV